MTLQRSVDWVVQGGLVCLLLLHAACARPLLTSRANSGSALHPVLQPLAAADQAALARFLTELAALLPARVKSQLPQRMAIDFAPQSQPLLPPTCSAAGPPELELASLASDGRDGEPLRIRLHAGFREVIRQGPERAAHYPCGHHDMYRLAQATVLHELLHAYDARQHVSADKQFANLHRFAPQGLFRRLRSRNELAQRSPDPYEFRSPEESFAVHGEFFLLDPAYRCRMPASYGFFASALGEQPFRQVACQQRTTVYDGAEPIDIDPSRVYAVHYLWASEGRGAQSRFGHAMLRLVICAPWRKSVDAACLSDVQDHVVLSFAANLHGELRIDKLKGLTGGYSSQLFVRPLPQTIIEYTERDLRDLYSFPLHLARAEIDALVLRVLEIFWAYSGRYYFLSNNCGTETLSLLRAVLPPIRTRKLWALTPRGLRNRLIRTGLAEPLDLARLDDLEQAGLFFPSARQGYESAYRRVRSAARDPLPRSMMSYLEHTSASQRRLLFARSPGPAQLSDLYALEGVAYRRRQDLVMAKLLRLYLRVERAGLYPELRKKVVQLVARGELYQPWRWSKEGYGVPLTEDSLDLPPALPAELMTELRGEIARFVSAELAAEHEELVRTEENQRWLAAQLLERRPR